MPGKFTHPKLKGWINDVPDTGQFLADSVWVLKVGPRVTTAGEFVSKYFSSYPEYRPPQDSLGRIKFLTSLLHKDVLGMTALAQNRPLRFEDRLAMRETRQRAAQVVGNRGWVFDWQQANAGFFAFGAAAYLLPPLLVRADVGRETTSRETIASARSSQSTDATPL